MNKLVIILILLFMSFPFFARADELFQKAIDLWPDGEMPYAIDVNFTETNSNGSVKDVSKPMLYFCPAQGDNKSDAAVLIIAGGGYSVIVIQHEGFNTANYLTSKGVNAFVLKYRHRPYKQPAPLADAQRAIRLIRRDADKYGINPNKIGVIGYSAGGHLAATISTMYDEKLYDREDDRDISARPDYSMLVYPVITMGPETDQGSKNSLLGNNPSDELIEKWSCQNRVTSDTPPTILFHSTDDTIVPVANSIMYYQSLIKNGVDAEMHIYSKGGHGFGVPGNPNLTSGKWTEALDNWGMYIARTYLSNK